MPVGSDTPLPPREAGDHEKKKPSWRASASWSTIIASPVESMNPSSLESGSGDGSRPARQRGDSGFRMRTVARSDAPADPDPPHPRRRQYAAESRPRGRRSAGCGPGTVGRAMQGSVLSERHRAPLARQDHGGLAVCLAREPDPSCDLRSRIGDPAVMPTTPIKPTPRPLKRTKAGDEVVLELLVEDRGCGVRSGWWNQYPPLVQASGSSLVASHSWVRWPSRRSSGALGPPILVGTQPGSTALLRRRARPRDGDGEGGHEQLAVGVGAGPRVPAPVHAGEAARPPRCMPLLR